MTAVLGAMLFCLGVMAGLALGFLMLLLALEGEP